MIYEFALSSSCNYNSNTYKEIIYTFFGSNEMGGACGTRGGVVQKGFGGEIQRERDHLKDLGLDGKIILDWVLKKSVGRA